MPQLIKISLDLKDIAMAIQTAGDRATLDKTMLMVAEATRRKWTQLAQEKLHSTRNAYIQGITQPFLEGPGAVSIELVGKLANMIEQGADAFDMREGLLNKPNTRVSKTGARYRYIPFRMSSPGSAGKAGTPMDEVYSMPGEDSRSGRQGLPYAFSGLIGQEMYELAKTLKRGQGLPNVGLPRLQAHHSVDPFTGMQRGGGKGHRYYVAFRTVTDNVSGKWQHPGFNAANLAVEAAQYAAKIAPKALGQLGRSLLSPKALPPAGSGEGEG